MRECGLWMIVFGLGWSFHSHSRLFADAFVPPASSRSSHRLGNIKKTTHESFSSIQHTGKRRESKLSMGWFDKGTKSSKNKNETKKLIHVQEHIGSGSYGTVHLVSFQDDDGKKYVAKRAWTLNEIKARPASTHKDGDTQVADPKALKGKAERCQYYLDVEQHCLDKIRQSDNADRINVPAYVGKFKDDSEEGNEWLLFDLITSNSDSNDKTVAKNLKEVMELDWIDQHREADGGQDQHHHLYMIHKELGLQDDATFEDTLDTILMRILKTVSGVHETNIVHRDIKPENLLIDGKNKDFILIDFGSAQDVDALKKMVFVFEGEATVALSPIYAAPECFIEWDKAPLNFDVFSVALIFLQLMFNLLDDITDAGVRQQLEDVDFDLDLWLDRELQTELVPAGLEDGLKYLGTRLGLWSLLNQMLNPNPKKRINSKSALEKFEAIMSNTDVTIADRISKDGNFFNLVIQDLELCTLTDEVSDGGEGEGNDTIPVRPLHFVASFDRSESIGLILSEADTTEEDEEYMHTSKWEAAIQDALCGEVFIRDIVENSQADKLGIFEIGDRVVGVGEFPLAAQGFETFLEMLQAVPQKSKTVKIHFDRRVSTVPSETQLRKSPPGTLSFVSQGVWTTKGRRRTQEDATIMSQIDLEDRTVLLTGICDGHGGAAASKFISQTLPSFLSNEVASNTEGLEFNLDTSWDVVCDSYRNGCMLDDENGCIAKFDAREGSLDADISSRDLVAGSTATIAAIEVDKDGIVSNLAILNCGDSRSLIIAEPNEESNKYVKFVTRDHVPSDKMEAKRLTANPNYSNPECSMNRYSLRVGDYRYALSRSLEGAFATSKGITSESDIFPSDVTIASCSGSKYPILIQASDGLFEVLDNEEVGRDAMQMRKENYSASDCAHYLCDLAKRKSSSDNISVLVIFLE